MKLPLRRVFAVVALSGCMSSPGNGAESGGSAAEGEVVLLFPLGNASVMIHGQDGFAIADRYGEARFRLPPGPYSVNVTALHHGWNQTKIEVVANQTIRKVILLEPLPSDYFLPKYEYRKFSCGWAFRNSTIGQDGRCQQDPVNPFLPPHTAFITPDSFHSGDFNITWRGSPSQKMLFKVSLANPARPFPDGSKDITISGASGLTFHLPPEQVDQTLMGGGILRFDAFAPREENALVRGLFLEVTASMMSRHKGGEGA